MKLDLDRQPSGRSELELAGQVDLELGEGRAPSADLSGVLTVQNLTGRVLLGGALRAQGTATCDRCLAEFELIWDVPVDLMVLRDVDSDETAGQTLLIVQRDGEVDLRDSLCECVALAYPQSTVCRAACQGICPHCGAERNTESCVCGEEEVDPRWEGLP